MKVKVNRWAAIAAWKWDLGKEDDGSMDDESEEDLCGICRLNYESCCPDCKIPGDDCPLSGLCSFFCVSVHVAELRILSNHP